MDSALRPIFEGLAAAEGDRIAYSVAAVPGFPGYYVGKDNDEKACLLIEIADRNGRQHAPIRLESLEVQFEVPSVVKAGGKIAEGTFTVIRCRLPEPEIIRYFLSIAETLLRILGVRPARSAIATAVNRLALIFQRLLNPPSRSVTGFFGELFVIRHSRSPLRALAAWRLDDISRFDFTAGDVRLDVKASAGRLRNHSFSYDQCNPPSGTIAIVASLFAERTGDGTSLGELVRDIERATASNTELVLKLHDIVAGTLGASLQEALAIRFDQRLAAGSLQFYDLRAVPAIRGNAPVGVSDIHFRSDLSICSAVSVPALIDRDPMLGELVPDPSKSTVA